MSINTLDAFEPISLDDLCKQECQESDISPATITLTPVCRPNATPVVIDCSQQLTGSTVELAQTFTSRTTQCSTEDAEKIPSGRSGSLMVSLTEAAIPPEMLELIHSAQWLETSPYEEDKDCPVLAALNNPGACTIKFRAEVCPTGGTTDLIFPYAQLYTENVTLQYNLTDQRELTLGLWALPDPRTQIVWYKRARNCDTFELRDSLLDLPV